MARITIEDCLEKIPNHFKLVLVAGRRARQLQDGATPKVEETGNAKPNIVALREIAAGVVGEDILDEPLIKDPTADAELAELIAHGLMNQDISPEFGRVPEDAGEGDGEDGAAEDAGVEMDPLEAGTETIEGIEEMADLNLDHLKAGDEPPDEDSDALAGELSESEVAAGEKLLSSVDKMFGESCSESSPESSEAGAEEGAPESAEEDAGDAQQDDAPAKEKPA